MAFDLEWIKNRWGGLLAGLAFISIITNGIVMSKLDKKDKVSSDEYRAATGSLIMSIMILIISLYCMTSHTSA